MYVDISLDILVDIWLDIPVDISLDISVDMWHNVSWDTRKVLDVLRWCLTLTRAQMQYPCFTADTYINTPRPGQELLCTCKETQSSRSHHRMSYAFVPSLGRC